MFCNKCGHDINNGDNFCPKCGLNTNSQYAQKQNIHSSKNSINFNIGSDTKVRIDKVENNIINSSDEIKGQDYKLKIGRKLFKANRIGVVGYIVSGIGLISSILTIYTVFKDGILNINTKAFSYLSTIFAISFVIGILLIILYKDITRKKFVTIFPKYLNINLILLEDGKVATCKVWGTCPKCQDKLHIVYNQNDGKYTAVCNRNPQSHRFEFDYTDIINQ